MIALIQRVKQASVSINTKLHSSIDDGLVILLGIHINDTETDIKYLTQKISKLRIFSDENNKMNISVKESNASILVVSQFTLCGDTKKGNRPSYRLAMDVDGAKKLYMNFLNYLSQLYSNIKSGTFQADMNVNLENHGPVTLIIRSNH